MRLYLNFHLIHLYTKHNGWGGNTDQCANLLTYLTINYASSYNTEKLRYVFELGATAALQ